MWRLLDLVMVAQAADDRPRMARLLRLGHRASARWKRRMPPALLLALLLVGLGASHPAHAQGGCPSGYRLTDYVSDARVGATQTVGAGRIVVEATSNGAYLHVEAGTSGWDMRVGEVTPEFGAAQATVMGSDIGGVSYSVCAAPVRVWLPIIVRGL
jgi:hypothetical protein